MTDLLYYQDAYQQEFTATINAVESADGATRIALDRTAFYPGGGGQPNDLGWLTVNGERYAVTAVKKEGATLWHTIGGALAIATGYAFDLAEAHPDADVRKANQAFVELMIPVHKGWATEMAQDVTYQGIQVHGGMGFTDLLGLHFWFKRIGFDRQVLGGPERVRSDAAQLQGLTATT